MQNTSIRTDVNHDIKIERAQNIEPHLPTAHADILASIREAAPWLLDRLTSYELAGLSAILDHHWYKAQQQARRQILAEGCIWDGEQILELNPAAVALGKLGGRSTSELKKAAAKANGKKGGRPKRAASPDSK